MPVFYLCDWELWTGVRVQPITPKAHYSQGPLLPRKWEYRALGVLGLGSIGPWEYWALGAMGMGVLGLGSNGPFLKMKWEYWALGVMGLFKILFFHLSFLGVLGLGSIGPWEQWAF